MRDQDQRGAKVAVHLEQQVDDALAGGVIKAAGGFVGKQQPGGGRKGARQGHALLLATRQGARIVSGPLGQPHAGQQLAGDAMGFRVGGQLQGQHDVFQRGHGRQQLEGLEDEAHLLRPPVGALLFVPGKQRLAVHLHVATGGQVQPGQQAQQRGLARARGTDDGHRLAGLHVEAHVVEDRQHASAIWYALAQVLDLDEGHENSGATTWPGRTG